jgi:hypothetical protein
MKLNIKNMVSNTCKALVKKELKKIGLHFIVVDLGEIDVMEDISEEQRNQLKIDLSQFGLELLDDKRIVLIEKLNDSALKVQRFVLLGTESPLYLF